MKKNNDNATINNATINNTTVIGEVETMDYEKTVKNIATDINESSNLIMKAARKYAELLKSGHEDETIAAAVRDRLNGSAAARQTLCRVRKLALNMDDIPAFLGTKAALIAADTLKKNKEAAAALMATDDFKNMKSDARRIEALNAITAGDKADTKKAAGRTLTTEEATKAAEYVDAIRNLAESLRNSKNGKTVDALIAAANGLGERAGLKIDA
jgi:hypothetical protein